MKIAIDAMGGDRAPEVPVAGAVMAGRELGVDIVLVGDEVKIRSELNRLGVSDSRFSIQHAGSVVEMDEPAAQSIRRKKDASISVAMDLVKNGGADAVVSAGHTGAAVAAATLKLRLLEGVDRPGIGVAFPTLGGPCFLIDVGANIEPKPIHFYQYAAMGDIYLRYILGKENPTVGILNIGTEETKGTEETRDAFQLLEKSKLNFVGNVEGRDIFNGSVDVIVCDGFVGNVVLKVAESIADAIGLLLKRELKKNYLSMVGAFLSKSAFDALRHEVDYAEYGGAPLLGINGTCIISHGSSSPKAIKNAVRVAVESVTREINRHILQDTELLEIKGP